MQGCDVLVCVCVDVLEMNERKKRKRVISFCSVFISPAILQKIADLFFLLKTG